MSASTSSETCSWSLSACGFAVDQPAFFLCLGLVPYLTPDANARVFSAVAAIEGEVVFDYPPTSEPQSVLCARLAEAGEPMRSTFGSGAAR